MMVMNKDGNRMESVAPMTPSASSVCVCAVAFKAIKSEVRGTNRDTRRAALLFFEREKGCM